MGKVLLARKSSVGGFEKLVAIKTILRELSAREDLRTMFLDEARLLSHLDHPAVAQVHDFGEEEQTLYLAMEYVAGVPFNELVAMGTPPGMAIRLMETVCRALYAAHELCDRDGHRLEVVHRDVSPENLMLSFDGHVKVLDFGIALMRGRQAPVTEYGMVKGKPPYLAPEQVKGLRTDHRSDIWSTGVVLWELLTGEHLFGGDSMYAIAKAVEEREILPPSAKCGQLPEGLDEVVLKALSRDPETRYQSARDFADDLRGIANSVAAPSIHEFAKSTLKDRREGHQKWLRSVLGGQAQAAPVGRPTGMRTVQAGEVGTLPTELPAPSITTLATLPPASRRSPWLAIVLIVAGVLAAGYFAIRPEPVLSAPHNDASVAVIVVAEDAGVDAATRVVDAAPTMDAAEVKPDARRRKRRRDAGRRVKRRVDASTSTKPLKAEGFGTMGFFADPYALVRVDGKQIGPTPQFKKRFAAGRHVVEFFHPDTNVLRFRKVVQLGPEDHRRINAP